MSTPSDNLNPPPAPSRVSYSLGRMLGVEDFQADQDYHRSSLARALLQLCGSGTVAGLNVAMPQIWQPQTAYGSFALVYDTQQNAQVNTGAPGTSGTAVTFGTTPGGPAVNDGGAIAWTNQGQVVTAGWRPSTTFSAPTALLDSNGNVQILTAASPFTTGTTPPLWNTIAGIATGDGSPSVPAWTCAGPQQLELTVSGGLAIDRVGRMIELPQTVCIYLQLWLAAQSASDLRSALHAGSIIADVFATFIPCTQGVTPSFATQDNYDATDAFAANRLLDSVSMQLVLRTDQNPLLPKDDWRGFGAIPSAVSTAAVQSLKQGILAASAGPAALTPFTPGGALPAENPPPPFDQSSVFLARVSIPATPPVDPTQAPTYNVNAATIDNLSRRFAYPPALVARTLGISSGAQS